MKISIENEHLELEHAHYAWFDHGYTTNTAIGRQNKRKRSYEKTLDLYVQ